MKSFIQLSGWLNSFVYTNKPNKILLKKLKFLDKKKGMSKKRKFTNARYSKDVAKSWIPIVEAITQISLKILVPAKTCQ